MFVAGTQSTCLVALLLPVVPLVLALLVAPVQAQTNYDFLYNEMTGSACLDLVDVLLPEAEAGPVLAGGSGTVSIAATAGGVSIDLLEDVSIDECRGNCTLMGTDCLGFEYKVTSTSGTTAPELGTCETWDLPPNSTEQASATATATGASSTCTEKLFVEYPDSSCYTSTATSLGSEGTNFLVDVMDDPMNMTECAEACLVMNTVVDEETGNTIIVLPPSTPPAPGSSEQPNPYCYAFQSVLGRCFRHIVPMVPTPVNSATGAGQSCFIRPVRKVGTLSSGFSPDADDSNEPSSSPTSSPTSTSSERTTSPSSTTTSTPTGTEPMTSSPTQQPTTGNQTQQPTFNPTQRPTENPTQQPTFNPTQPPTWNPTQPPTRNPTQPPTLSPTQRPTGFPSSAPTRDPTVSPTPFTRNGQTYGCNNVFETLIISMDDWDTSDSASVDITKVGYTDGSVCSALAAGNEQDAFVYFNIKLECKRCTGTDILRFPQNFKVSATVGAPKGASTDHKFYFTDKCGACQGDSLQLGADSLPYKEEFNYEKFESNTDLGLVVRSDQISGKLNVKVTVNVQEDDFFPSEEPTWSPTSAESDYPTWYPTEEPTWYPTWSPTEEPTWSPTEEPTLSPECKVCPDGQEMCNEFFGLAGQECKEFEQTLALIGDDAAQCSSLKRSATQGDCLGRDVQEVCGCSSSCPYPDRNCP